MSINGFCKDPFLNRILLGIASVPRFGELLRAAVQEPVIRPEFFDN